jgi:hypothetical protein
MSNARELRSSHPEIARDLDGYVEQATDVRTLLEQLRVMFLARRAEVENDRAHMQAVARWATAFQSTRCPRNDFSHPRHAVSFTRTPRFEPRSAAHGFVAH